MAGTSRYTVVLDACVLYPAPVRDILLSLAYQGLCHARWTDQINEEWIRNLLKNRPDLDSAKLRRTTDRISQTILDWQISGYSPFIETIKLPDPNDRHVVAAALIGHADAIVTFNLRDFPKEALEPLGLEAQHPDDFVLNQLHLSLPEALKAIKAMRQRLVKPPQSVAQLLATLARCGLPQTASMLSEYAELL